MTFKPFRFDNKRSITIEKDKFFISDMANETIHSLQNLETMNQNCSKLIRYIRLKDLERGYSP